MMSMVDISPSRTLLCIPAFNSLTERRLSDLIPSSLDSDEQLPHTSEISASDACHYDFDGRPSGTQGESSSNNWPVRFDLSNHGSRRTLHKTGRGLGENNHQQEHAGCDDYVSRDRRATLSTSMKARYGCAGDMLTSFQYVTRKGSPLLESRRPRYLAHASPSRTRIYSGAGLARTSRYCAEMIKNPLILCGFMTLEKYAGKLFSPFSRNSLKRRSHKA